MDLRVWPDSVRVMNCAQEWRLLHRSILTYAVAGMPQGKPAYNRCVPLNPLAQCSLFGLLDRPAMCTPLRPSADMLGSNGNHALIRLARRDRQIAPDSICFQT